MKRREAHLKRIYGITLAQYASLLEKQEGNCAVCKRHHTEFKTRLCVDHDHKTREIRGLLCIHCNRYVIGRHRDPDLFQKAAIYLSQGSGWFVPKKRKKKRKKRKMR